MAATTKLEHPLAGFSISLMVDASNTHVSIVLQHFRCSSLALLSFFSRKLSAETCYIPFERELLAVHAAICHFHLMLKGWEFFSPTTSLSATPWTDCQLLGLQPSSCTWPIFLSSPEIYVTSLARTLWPWMLSHAHLCSPAWPQKISCRSLIMLSSPPRKLFVPPRQLYRLIQGFMLLYAY